MSLKVAKTYKKRILNKWHLLILLMKNPILILLRKNNLNKSNKRNNQKSKCWSCCQKNDIENEELINESDNAA